MLFAVTMEAPGILQPREKRDARLVGFGAVICPFCENQLPSIELNGRCHCGAVIIGITSTESKKAAEAAA